MLSNLEPLVPVIFTVGLVVLASVRTIERWVGHTMVGPAIVFGAMSNAVVLLLSATASSAGLEFYRWASGGVLLWMAGAYALFHFSKPHLLPQFAPSGVDHCKSEKTASCDKATLESPKSEDWRTYLFAVFFCSPGDSILEERAWAAGGAYYGLWYDAEEVGPVTPTITLKCENVEGHCDITDSAHGAPGGDRKPVRLYISNNPQCRGNTCTDHVFMSASLSANGGPSLSPMSAAGWITVSWPDASKELPMYMGTYQWRCKKEAADEGSSSSVGHGG